MLCYYSSFSDKPSAWLIIALILFLAWGVLNIILFFKLWKACGDVRRIAAKLTEQRSLGWSDLLMLGRKEEAADLVIRQLIGRLNSIYEARKRIGEGQEDAPAYYRPAITEAQWKINIIGAQGLPSQISSPQAFLEWKLKTGGRSEGKN